MNSTDVNDSFKSFFKVFVKLYDECFLPLAVTRTKQLTTRKPLPVTRTKHLTSRKPLAVTRTKQLTPRKPWITQVILTSIKKKTRFYRDYLKKNTTHETVKYKKYKNKLTKIIKAAEKSYYLCQFDNVKSDIKQTWK